MGGGYWQDTEQYCILLCGLYLCLQLSAHYILYNIIFLRCLMFIIQQYSVLVGAIQRVKLWYQHIRLLLNLDFVTSVVLRT